MAGPKRNRRRISHNKVRPKKKRVARSSPRTVIPSRGLNGFSAMRNFSLYPHQWVQKGTSWLDSLAKWGAVAMRIFSTFVTVDNKHLTTTWTVTGTVQAIAFGVEDLVWSSPLREMRPASLTYIPGVGAASTYVPSLDYRQGKVNTLSVKLTCGSELAKRAGRVTLALYPLSATEAAAYQQDKSSLVVPTYDELLLMPGAVTAPLGTVVSRTWSPKSCDYGHLINSLGQVSAPTAKDGSDLKGGAPVVVVCVGYQDMAASTADPSALYAPEEALFNVDVSANVNLRDWGTVYTRSLPISGPSDTVSCELAGSRIPIPTSRFTPTRAGLQLPFDALSQEHQTLALLQGGAHEVRVIPCDFRDPLVSELEAAMNIVSP